MPRPRFNKFYRYNELTQLLKAYVKEYPKLFKLESIGKSYEGRDVWLITATNFKSGEDADKPALWVDGNIHASEVTASAACLYFIHTLATKYGKDKQVTAALDTRAFYIVPRLNPDGAEWALADKPKVIRSSTRPYPYDEEPVDGLLEEDIDGDGRILLMRVPDPNGTWKRHPNEPRLLIRREPTETGGKYYRVLPEGFLKNYDGVTIQLRSPKEGLDLNRNYPIAWRTESEQHGAGPYPTSEPEVRNQIDFIVKHKNITGAVSFHTFAATIMRPYDDRSDDEFPAEDLWTYKKIGEEGTRLTGIQIFRSFMISNIIPSHSLPARSIPGCTIISVSSHGQLRYGVQSGRPESRTINILIGFASIRSLMIGRSLSGATQNSRARVMWIGTSSIIRNWAKWNWAAGIG